MKCIICESEANEVGSHIIPASLIKNCVGAHYREESYNIDIENAKIETYFGRDNLKNPSTEIKPNEYKRDFILCKVCEKKLSDIESKFATEFLQKFRDDKFKSNFNISFTPEGLELYEPKKITNEEIFAYFFSIILRYCRVYEKEDNYDYLSTDELEKIRKFVCCHLYKSTKDFKAPIADFSMSMIFNKHSDKSLFISTSKMIKSPYVFFFCDAIIQLFTEKLNHEKESLFNNFINNISQGLSKIVVGPEDLYLDFSKKISEIMAQDFIINGVNQLCELNKKSFEENMKEVHELLIFYDGKGHKEPIVQVLKDLTKKYSS